MKLTKQGFIDGYDDLSEIKLTEIKAFCAEQGLDVVCAPARGKAKIMNEIVDALEGTETTATPQEAPPEPEQSAPKLRENGEVIKLAKDGKDYGANLLNRLH